MIIPLSEWTNYGIEVTDSKGQPAFDPVEYAATSGTDEKVVLDLHVGAVAWKTGPDAGRKIREREKLSLGPGDVLRVNTRERFTVGGEAFGQICSRASLTASGLVVANIKVDPHFRGDLEVTLYNVGPDRVVVPRKDGFCSVFFQALAVEVPGPIRTGPGAPARDFGEFRQFLYRNRRAAVTIVLSLVVSVLGSLIATEIADGGGSEPRPPASSTTTSAR